MTDQENNNSISSNPFAALFGSIADAKQFAAVQKQQQLRQLTGLAGREAGAGPSGRGETSPAGRLRSRVLQAMRLRSAKMTPTTALPRAWMTATTRWPRSAAPSARSGSCASSSTSTT